MKSKKKDSLSTIILTLLACGLTGTVVFLIIVKVVGPILGNGAPPQQHRN